MQLSPLPRLELMLPWLLPQLPAHTWLTLLMLLLPRLTLLLLLPLLRLVNMLLLPPSQLRPSHFQLFQPMLLDSMVATIHMLAMVLTLMLLPHTITLLPQPPKLKDIQNFVFISGQH